MLKSSDFKIKTRFLLEWILAIFIAWPVGIVLAIILSYAVVIVFYPKHTNLILGLCIGGAVGFAQWLVLKKYFEIKGWWIFACAIGIGIPYILMVILDNKKETPFDICTNNWYI